MRAFSKSGIAFAARTRFRLHEKSTQCGQRPGSSATLPDAGAGLCAPERLWYEKSHNRLCLVKLDTRVGGEAPRVGVTASIASWSSTILDFGPGRFLLNAGMCRQIQA